MDKIKIKVSNSSATLKLMLFKYNSIFVVYDRNVEVFVKKAFGKYPSLAISASEETKTMDSVLRICQWLLEQGADRKALVLAVGGGITTDMVGFAASIYKRGIRYANIPTSLLAQVDAAIGGKTAVNLDSYKNILGSIKLPEFTFISTKTLETLPPRDYNAGIAEMLKTFIIKDEIYYERAVEVFSGERNPEDVQSLIEAAAKFKASIVKKDIFDSGNRRVLNFGHTYAHAVEWFQHSHGVTGAFNHGEAVAIGMIQAARKSEELGCATPGLADRLAKDFAACGLPTSLPCPEEELDKAIRQDKKAEGNKVNYVLIEKIGKVFVKRI
ncbi:MAG: 3-dehydroquinate synthase [Bacteroidales bacterium]|nr:3-dehydroquinate synthase [Bacteroidales bacterium]